MYIFASEERRWGSDGTALHGVRAPATPEDRPRAGGRMARQLARMPVCGHLAGQDATGGVRAGLPLQARPNTLLERPGAREGHSHKGTEGPPKHKNEMGSTVLAAKEPRRP